jgi:hypothetical protein
MNPQNRTVRLTALPLAIAMAMAMFLTVAPCVSAVARAQTLQEAGKAAATKTTEQEKDEDKNENEDEGEDERANRPRGGLGWTGIGLMSAGGMLLLGSFTFNDSKGCGFFNELSCGSVGRVYGGVGGTMAFTGLTLLVMDENRRYPKVPRAAARQTSIALGPRAIQVRMVF